MLDTFNVPAAVTLPVAFKVTLLAVPLASPPTKPYKVILLAPLIVVPVPW